MEVFVYDCEIKVLHSVVHSLKVDDFNVVQVKHEERELTNRNEAVLSGFDPDDLFGWAAIERKLFFGNFDLNRGSVSL